MPCRKKKGSYKRLNNKGSIAFFIVFAFLAFITLTIFVFMLPILIDFNTRAYATAENLLVDANTTAQDIQNPTVKASFESVITSSTNSIPTQVEILGFFFQYSWIIVLVVITLALYMYTRQSVEAEGGMY